MNYSNPRTHAVIENWPGSFTKRVTATFSIESNPKHGERAVRVTTGAPKRLTYATLVRIVDGEDGRTYIAEWSKNYRSITIMKGDMKFWKETISRISEPDRYFEALKTLFEIEGHHD